MIKYSASANVEKYQINSFEFQILVFQSLAAAVSLVCISHNLRKYGFRKFLFVDRYHGHMAEFADEYAKKIRDFFFLLAVWVFSSLLLKILHEIIRVIHVHRDSWWQATASQVVALLQTTGNKGIINLMNRGDFVIASIAELVGLILCLHSAAKTSHRSQAIASVATKWHSLVTCSSNDAAITSSSGNLEAPNMDGFLPVNCSESDLEAVDFVPVPASSQSTSSYHKRQAFVTYLQSNPGGFTVFGWTIDRALVNTIFFLEVSLVLFVLGMTINFTSK